MIKKLFTAVAVMAASTTAMAGELVLEDGFVKFNDCGETIAQHELSQGINYQGHRTWARNGQDPDNNFKWVKFRVGVKSDSFWDSQDHTNVEVLVKYQCQIDHQGAKVRSNYMRATAVNPQGRTFVFRSGIGTFNSGTVLNITPAGMRFFTRSALSWAGVEQNPHSPGNFGFFPTSNSSVDVGFYNTPIYRGF